MTPCAAKDSMASCTSGVTVLGLTSGNRSAPTANPDGNNSETAMVRMNHFLESFFMPHVSLPEKFLSGNDKEYHSHSFFKKIPHFPQ